jgi:tetratricopeptide (TPR) repeat protein
MSLVKQARAAWFLAAVWAVGATPAHAQPRRGGNRPAAQQQQQAAEDGEVPTVPTVAANVCIADERRAAAVACPEGSASYGSHGSTAPPSAARPDQNQRPAANNTRRGPAQQLDTQALLRRQNLESRSQELLLREAQLTGTLIRRMSRNDPHRADTLMRLAEDYQELSQQANGRAEDLEENLFRARNEHNDAQVTAIQRQQQEARAQGTQYRDQLIQTFRVLVQDHTDYAQMDRALFYLAFAYQDAHNFNEARTVYRTLIQRFPNSPFVPNAYLSFAEYFFDQGEMENARQFYERVLSVQDESNQVYGYALYKMAWVLYNLQDHEGSLAKFFEVIEYGRNHPNAPTVTPLLRNARMELVAVYGQVYGTAQRPLNPTNALNTFRRYGADEDNAFTMFERLAELYHDNGQWPNSIATYHALMEQRATSDSFCHWQAQVSRAVVATSSADAKMVEVQRLIDVYNAFRQSSRTAEIKTACRNEAARVTFDVASHWHLEAVGRSAEGQQQTRGTRNSDTMRRVAQLYQKLLDEFPELDQVEFPEYDRRDWPSRYRISYYQADILRDQQNYAECGPAYDRVVEMNPRGEFTEDAAYKAVLCYNDLFTQQLQTRSNVRGARSGGEVQRGRTPTQSASQQRAERRRRMVPRDLNQQEQGMLRAFTRYACFVRVENAQAQEGEDPRTVMLTIKYRRAYLYYNANKFEEAATLFREVAHSDVATPDPENLREISADLFLDALNVMGDMWNPQRPACFDAMAEELPQLLGIFCSATTRPQHEDFCGRIEQLQCQVLRKKAEALGNTRRFPEAAREYISIVRAHRECGRQDEMLYNAAIMYDAGLLLGRSMRVRERLVQLFLERNSPWAQRALYRLAGNYHAIQVFGRAAQLYEQFADYVNTHRTEAVAAARAAAQQAREAGSSAPEEDPVAQAADALRQATIFRIGLGEENRALQNAEKFARYYRTDPQRRRVAANVVFSIGQIYSDRVTRLRRQASTANSEQRREIDTQIRTAWNDLIRHYSGFMRTYAAQGTLDQQIQGAVALARGYWNISDFRQAEQYFNQAVTSWGATAPAAEGQTRQPSAGERQIREQLGDEAGDAIERSREAVAEAKFHLAEVLYNRFMAARMPSYSGGGTRRAFDTWSTRTLTPYIQNRQRTLDEASTRYQELMRMDSPNWKIAAAARLADMYFQFAQTIRTAPVAPDIQRNPDLIDAYNVRRDEVTQPFINSATTGFQLCIQTATREHWFNEWSQLCERNLNVIDRLRFPLADEIRVEPNQVFSRASNARALYQLSTSAEGEEEGGNSNPGAEATDTPAATPAPGARQ